MADTSRHQPAGALRPAPQSPSALGPVIRTVLAAVRSAMIAQHLRDHPGDTRVAVTDHVHALPDAAVADWLRNLLPASTDAPAARRWWMWDQTRLDVLRTSFERDGWHVAASGRYADCYELDLGPEGVAQALVPRTTEARDTSRRAYEAADTLIKISGQPHLELGPLSDREALWADRPTARESTLDRTSEPWQLIGDDHKTVNYWGQRLVVTDGVLRPWTGAPRDVGDERARLASYCLPKRRNGTDGTICHPDRPERTS
jgi:hypothetical protein